MDFLPLIIQLVSGAVGGNIAGSLLKNLDLGPVGNSIVGILGGGLGGQLLSLLGVAAAPSGSLDLASLVGSVAAGGAGGGALMAIVGALKQATRKA
jgi:uncharacterized membrane protein YeaQ/YmgE (transglycosylase-associated protein family)